MKIHPVLLLLAGPFLGLAYAIFLPFIGIAMFVMLLGRKLFAVGFEGFQRVAIFTWAPCEAYFVRKAKAVKKEKKHSEQSEREGEAPTALPLEGATQAPTIEEKK